MPLRRARKGATHTRKYLTRIRKLRSRRSATFRMLILHSLPVRPVPPSSPSDDSDACSSESDADVTESAGADDEGASPDTRLSPPLRTEVQALAATLRPAPESPEE